MRLRRRVNRKKTLPQMKPNPDKTEALGAHVPPAPLEVVQASSDAKKGHNIPKPPVNLPVPRPPGDPIAKPNAGHRVPVQPPTTTPPEE